MIQSWRLDTHAQTLILAAEDNRLAEVVYWGKSLPEGEDLEQIYHAHRLDVTGGMLDANPALSICPEAAQTFPGQPGMIARAANAQPLLPIFSFQSEKLEAQQSRLVLTYESAPDGLLYEAIFESFADSNIINAKARVVSKAPIHLDWLAAPVMAVSQQAKEMLDFAGRWCGEFQEVRTAWQAGIRARENRTGRTGHEHFPALIIPEQGARNTQGSVYGFHYGWSGGHKMIAEELADGRRQVQFGHASGIEHAPAHEFETAPLYLTYSDNGMNGVARAFQRHLRKHVITFPAPERTRPVHYNCWEAIYFDHNLAELKDIATHAAALGAERFVLDDGWFGSRDDDTRALSEWEIDPRKYPDGLAPLIAHIHAQGMRFGIWFEPEMISPKSSVYLAHPEWALGHEAQILGRHQKALNMDLPQVQDFLFERISAILAAHEIDYIKWDHNRVLPMPDAAQTRGTYALLDRIRATFPDVEIESCASGGGRIDFGILERAHRVWLSDSNDALERARMQHNSALFLPACITGSHVGPRQSHTSGRVHDIHFRAWIAAQRHMGFEMDPRKLSATEAGVLKRITAWWKAQRDWMMHADILRLDSTDRAVIAEQHLSEDETRFVIFVNKIDSANQIAPRPIRATALDESALYAVELVNRDEAPKLSRGQPLLKHKSLRVSGAYLMHYGLTMPWSFPGQTWVIEGKKL